MNHNNFIITIKAVISIWQMSYNYEMEPHLIYISDYRTRIQFLHLIYNKLTEYKIIKCLIIYFHENLRSTMLKISTKKFQRSVKMYIKNNNF